MTIEIRTTEHVFVRTTNGSFTFQRELPVQPFTAKGINAAFEAAGKLKRNFRNDNIIAAEAQSMTTIRVTRNGKDAYFEGRIMNLEAPVEGAAFDILKAKAKHATTD